MNTLKKFDDFAIQEDNFKSLEYLNTFGAINESHEYFDSISSVIGKTMTYSRNYYKLMGSNLNESAKRTYDRDVYFNRNEKVGASMLFNEIYNNFLFESNIELDIYDAIINSEIEFIDEEFNLSSVKKWVSDVVSKGSEIKEKTLDKAASIASKVIQKTGEGIKSGVKKASDAKDELVSAAKKLKDELTEKIKKLYNIVYGIVKKGISSVKDLIKYLLDAFCSIGDNFIEIAKGLGVYGLDKGEKPLNISLPDGIDVKMGNDDDKNLFNHIFEFTNFILEDDSESSKKLMEEGIKDIFNNKYIVWAKGMISSVEISTWKTIFFSLASSIFVNLLPRLLGVVLGVGCPIIPFVMALISLCINIKGMLRLIKQRNAQRKPGEKFFDLKTGIFFAISLLSTVMSLAAIVETFGPALAEICRAAGIIDDTEGFSGWLSGVAKQLDARAALRGEGHWEKVGEETISTESVNTTVDMDVATKFGKEDAKLVLKARRLIGGDFGGEIGQGINDKILPGIGTYGANGILSGDVNADDYRAKLVKKLISLGADESHAKELAKHVFLKKSTSIMTSVQDKLAYVQGALVPLTSKMPFVATFIPFLSKSSWGHYKMRFASATKGYPAYVVEKSEIIEKDKISSLGGGTAVDNLVKLHDESFKAAKNIIKDENNGEDVEFEEPQFIVVYVNKNADTKNDLDKANKKDDEKSKSNGAHSESKEDKKDDVVAGILIDPLTLMCADVCTFNKRRRKQPYFLKGIFAKLSFRPVADNDNKSKEFIRTKLFGDTLSSSIRNCVVYGAGRKYIEIASEGEKKDKKIKAVVRETVYGTEEKINADKVVDELGYMSPNEIAECLNDFFENNSTKKCYDLLDGGNATRVVVKEDKDGKLVKKITNDKSAIENVRYYKVSDDELNKINELYQEKLDKYEEYKKLSKDDKKKKKDEYEEELKAYNEMSPSKKRKNKKPFNFTKKPSKPKFEYDADGNKYKKASKAIIKKLGEDELKDYVDIKIVPLINDKEGKVYKALTDDEKIKKILFKDDKLNMDAITVLKPFLFRPEKTFSENDEYALKNLLNGVGVEGEKLSNNKVIRGFLNLFKDEEQEHDTFKKIVEIIWDELSNKARSKYSDIVDNHQSGSVKEGMEYIFENDDDYFNEECEAEYDECILEMRDNGEYDRVDTYIMNFNDFVKSRR